MIGTAAAILGAAVIGGVATAHGASQAGKAANYAADQSAEAARENNALQERIYNQTRVDNEPWRNTGVSALSAISGGFGLPPSMTSPTSAPSYASTPVPGVSGVSMTAPGGGAGTTSYATATGRADDTFIDPRTGLTPGAGGAGGPPMGAAPSAPATSSGAERSPDWAAYLKDNPDVLANAQQRVADGSAQSLEQVAAEQYAAYGKDENRALPMHPIAGAPGGGPGGPAPGYADPTAPGGYMTGARPNPGPGPGAYVDPGRGMSPVRMTDPTLDLSDAAFHKSPGYEFAVHEAEKSINNQASGASSVLSGARLKALSDRRVGMANQEYQDWRNFTTGQFNLDRGRQDAIFSEDRGRGDSIYSEDRQFGYGQARDARGDFVQDRSRSDGLYQDDRSRLDARYDTRNNNLMTLAGFGPAANASNASAATSFAANTGNNNMTAANARGDAKIAGANAFNAGVNGLMTTGAYLAGNYLSGGFGNPSLPRTRTI